MKTSRLALGANPCGATHPCASVSTRPAPSSARFGRIIRHLAATLCLGVITQTASAASVKLAWNQNPEPDIADYKLSYGSGSGAYSNTVNSGGATTVTVSGLTEGQTYFFVVKAVNTEGLQSQASTEIFYRVPTSPPTPVNQAPVAANQSLNATAGTPRTITLAASDVDGNSLTYRVIGNPAQGTLSGTAPNLTYTPLATASGSDSFTFRANDGSLDSNTATVSIGITPAGNTSPVTLISSTGWRLVSASSEETTGENGRATNSFDGNPKTIWHSTWDSYLALPPHEIRIDLGKSESIKGLRYLPRQDGLAYGNIGRYEFHVSSDGSNWGSPVANGSFVNDQREKEVLFPATSGRYILLRTFEDASGGVSCSVAELKLLQGPILDVTPPANDAPLAAGQSVAATEDTAVAIVLSASDKNNDSLTYSIVGSPSMGTLSGSAPNLTYTPKADVNGTDSFTFRVNDGKADSNTATVSISISPVNDAPGAAAQLAATAEDKPVGILLSASDKDGDSLSYHIVSSPTKGSLSGSAPNLTYTPNRDANGTDSFSFRANDGTANSNIATVSISISQVNDAPIAAAQVLTTASDTSVSIVLSASDADGDFLTFSIVGGPAKGSLSGSAPNLTYIPNADASGPDSFSFRANDGKTDSNTATVSITITAPEKPENKAPVFQTDRLTRANGKTGESYSAESLAGSAIDPDGDAVTYLKTEGPEWLVVSSAGEISGTPPTEAEGLNSFTIRAADPEGAFAEVMLEITIDATDELPLPWSMERIGSVAPDATATGETPSSLKVKSNGSLAGREDNGIVTWQTLSGDGEITAKIAGFENAGSSSRIGLTIRDTLAPNSKHVFIGADGNGSLRFIRRSRTGGSTSLSNVGIGRVPNLWLRLGRSGNSINAYYSQDGSNWRLIGETKLPMGSTGYIGLMVSGGGDTPSTGTFQDVTVTP